MRLFLFAIGGTGARVVRSLTMMLASGINWLDNSVEIIPIIIDYDLSNGDKQRALDALRGYNKIHSQLYKSGEQNGAQYADHFFMTRLSSLREVTGDKLPRDYELFFGTAGSNMRFSDYLGVGTLRTNTPAKPTLDLLTALYDESDANDIDTELELDLTVGFKGHPNVGSVVFHELRSTDEMKSFFGTYDVAKGDRVFIVSSIFGGTGSSGFPEIVKSIRNHNNPNVRNAIIGASVVLPYFGLSQPEPGTGVGAIDPGSFQSKTVAALNYYETSKLNSDVDAIYYIGDENIDNYDYHEGSSSQINKAHVAELVAATSIVDFIKRGVTRQAGNAFEFGIKEERKAPESIKLDDFYSGSNQLFLDDLSVFALAMKYYRDVVCGDRNKISSTVAFYSDTEFALSGKLRKGVFNDIDDFLGKDYEHNSQHVWGFYSWLNEMLDHNGHKLALYHEGSKHTLNDFLAYKPLKKKMFASLPTDDSNINSLMSKRSAKSSGFSDVEFFKVLRDVAKQVYAEAKNYK